MSLGSSKTAGPPVRAAATASGSADTMSSRRHNPPAEHRNRGEQRLCVQRAVAAAGVLEGAATVERGRRLADQRQYRHAAGERLAQPRHGVQAPAARGRGHDAEPGTAAAVAVGHGRGGELVFGQHRGDVVTEERGVVEVLDIGAVDTEDEVDATRRKVFDDVVNNPMPTGHISPASRAPTSDTTRNGVGFTRVARITGVFSSRTFPSSGETSCTAAISSFCIGVVALGSAVAPDSPSHVATWVWLPSRPTTTMPRFCGGGAAWPQSP